MAQRRMKKKEEAVCLDANYTKYSYVFKIVLLGTSSVGKSSLAYRYVKKDFRDSLPTVGCSFFMHHINLNNKTIKFEIWDTAGQEKYHSVCHLYYRGANAAVLVYDITKKESLEKAKIWLRELEKEFLNDEIITVLVGNKVDLSAEREVKSEEAQEFAKAKSMLHMETSAKSNHQVTELFMTLAHELLKQEQQKGKPFQKTFWKTSSVDLQEMDFNQMKCCKI